MSDGIITTGIMREDERGAVAMVTIDRTAKLNVVTGAMCRDLAATVNSLAARDDVRVVVLRGAGERALIGGADIAEMAALGPKTARAFITDLHNACDAIRGLPVPVIARMRGYCLGGGLEIAASCDFRIAAEDARMAMPEVRVGIPSVIEAALLPELIGWGRTRRLLFTGEMIDAAKAYDWGLVEQVVEASALDGAIDDSCEAIMAAGPGAIRAQKALIAKWRTLPLDAAIEAGIDSFAAAFQTDEPRRYMRRFLDRPRRC
jgi:enoyl-CoA hydratase/carnithine racemase